MFERIFGKDSGSTLIKAAFEDVSAMLRHSARMLDLATAALLDNVPLEVDLDHMDDRVDESERMVRRTVLEYLSVDPQQDLVANLSDFFDKDYLSFWIRFLLIIAFDA